MVSLIRIAAASWRSRMTSSRVPIGCRLFSGCVVTWAESIATSSSGST
jgi:hypothetical protein